MAHLNNGLNGTSLRVSHFMDSVNLGPALLHAIVDKDRLFLQFLPRHLFCRSATECSVESSSRFPRVGSRVHDSVAEFFFHVVYAS